MLTFRPHDWFDLKAHKPRYGIQAKRSGSKVWSHACEGTKPCIYDTREERDAKIAEFAARERST